VRRWGTALLVLCCLLLSASAVGGSHKPYYKGSVDFLGPNAWEVHFVWLRSDYFNYMGQVWWQVAVDGPGTVDVLFFDLPNFDAFRDGRSPQTLLAPLLSVADGSQYISGLTGDLPYFLVLRNSGSAAARVNWTIFAEIDWRRWQGEPAGPDWNLTVTRASPPLDRSDSWETPFTSPAVYVYHCLPHVDMTGIVEVVDTNETPVRVDVAIHDMGFHPEVIRIPVGSTVNWTNFDNMSHSVNLGLLPGGFVLPPASTSPFPLAYAVVAIAVSAAAIGLLVLRRKRRATEGRSKSGSQNRTDAREHE